MNLESLHSIDYDYLPEQVSIPSTLMKSREYLQEADFDGRVDIIPVSDPNIPSPMHIV